MAHLALLEPKELKILKAIKGKHVASPLEIDYWSGTPFWLGPASGEGGHAVKYSAVSHQAGLTPPPATPKICPTTTSPAPCPTICSRRKPSSISKCNSRRIR